MIEVLTPGKLDLVIDTGRPGHAASGVPVGGAADIERFIAANRLVGNAPDAAGLECLLVGPRLRFPKGGVVALVGAAFTAERSSGVPVRWDETLVMRPGEVLHLGHARQGCRCWLAVRGGIRVPRLLGSRSTFLPGGWGGFHGRALTAGDHLPVGSSHAPLRVLRLEPRQTDDGPLRVIAGPQVSRYADDALIAFFSGVYHVQPATDRRGVRLTGTALSDPGPELASQAVLPGCVQIPPNGEPIILGWDGPVTGGYPVIATVIGADLARLAQLKPGDAVRFTTLSVEAARLSRTAAIIETIE